MNFDEATQYVGDASRIIYSKFPRRVKLTVPFDDVEGSAWLAWYTLESTHPDRSSDPDWARRHLIWKTLEILRSQKLTDQRKSKGTRPKELTFTDVGLTVEADQVEEFLHRQEPDAPEEVLDPRTHSDVLDDVDTLTDDERTVMKMLYAEGISYKVVEKELGMSGYRMQKVRLAGRKKVAEALCTGR